MHILILGGSGRTGQLVIAEALARNHTLTALVRNPASLTAQPGLTLVPGKSTNKSDIEAAFAAPYEKPDAVITTLNAPRASDSPFAKPLGPPRIMADSLTNVRAVMKTHGVKRLVIMSAFGVGESIHNLNFLMRPVLRYTNMAAQFADHLDVDCETRMDEGWGLEWVLVRPAMLKGEDKAVVRDLGNEGENCAGFMPSISRRSVAGFLVDAVEKRDWIGRSVVIAN